MRTVREIEQALYEMAPKDLAFGWDNVGQLLGDPELAPGILAALGKQTGSFRSPGDGMPFAMYRGGSASYFAFPLE